jgi:hypothetical protein
MEFVLRSVYLGRTHHDRHDLGFGEVELLRSPEKRPRNGQAPTSTAEVNRPAAMGGNSPRKKRSFALTYNVVAPADAAALRLLQKKFFGRSYGTVTRSSQALSCFYAAIAVNFTKHFSFRP